MFKTGDRLECINNKDQGTLTVGKFYICMEDEYQSFVKVTNDIGTTIDYLTTRFICKPIIDWLTLNREFS